MSDCTATDMEPLVVVEQHVLTPVDAPMESPMWSKLTIFAKEAFGGLSDTDMIKLG